MGALSRSEIIGIISLAVAIVACIAAWLVVPELRQWLRLGSSPLSEESDVDQNGSKASWPDAINKAIENFAKLHPDASRITRDNINVIGRRAQIQLLVWGGRSRSRYSYKSYKLIVDKTGNIVEINQEDS